MFLYLNYESKALTINNKLAAIFLVTIYNTFFSNSIFGLFAKRPILIIMCLCFKQKQT